MGQQGRLIAVTHPICINMIRIPQDESRSGSSQVVVYWIRYGSMGISEPVSKFNPAENVM